MQPTSAAGPSPHAATTHRPDATAADATPRPALGSMCYRVPYGDTDCMGVVYYANYLGYFERCRNELLRATGFTYREMEARGFGLPVIEAHVDYHAPACYDDLLDLGGSVAWARGCRIRIDCRVARGAQVLASGYTVHCCIDLRTRRPARVPAELLAQAPADGG